MRNVLMSMALICAFVYSSNAQELIKAETTPYHSIEHVKLDQNEYINFLTPIFQSKSEKAKIEIELPVSKNRNEVYVASPRYIMDKKFQAEYPNITTYRLYNKNNPTMQGRLTVSPDGVFALVDDEDGGFSIFPEFHHAEKVHYIQRGKDPIAERLKSSHCQAVKHEHNTTSVIPDEAKGPTGSMGNVLRVYRFQAMTTGEFYQGNGATFSTVSAVVTSSINAIEQVYERDLGLNFTVLSPIIRTDPFTDNLNPNGNRTGDAQREIENAVSVNSYDIGHVLHKMTSGGSGVAGLSVVCSDSRKAAGWSGSSRNTTTGWYDLFSHEVGHMCGAPHTFNAIGGACTTNISSSTSYEIGSGSTIMSYNGSGCESNIPGTGAADLYFHSNSLDRMVGYLKNTSCADERDIGNTVPEVEANECGQTYIIPKQTPFRLIGTADDTEDVTLTYSWEQYDEDGPGTPTQGLVGLQAANRTNTPIFRSYPPTSSRVRVFPKMSDIINRTSNVWEVLSNVGRILTFRFIARDNHQGGGGVAWDQFTMEVGSAGPMTVEFPKGGETVSVGNTQPFSWNVNGTDNYCDVVDILLSLDGGNSFNIVLAEDVDYGTGTTNIMIPNGVSNTEFARVMVRCSDTECVQFFDISDSDFTINSTCKAENTNICPNESLIANSGDFALDLGLTKVVGVEEASMFVEIDEVGTVMVAPRDSGNGNCTPTTQQRYERVPFRVTTDGQYNFSLELGRDENVSTINIFEANNFDPGNACSGWVAGNTTVAPGDQFSVDFTLTTDLQACVNYYMVFYSGQARDSIGSIDEISGPGSIIVNTNDTPPTGLAYTYLAFDVNTGELIMIRPDSDFRDLEAGSYEIVGVSYSTDGPLQADPNNWVGLTISELFTTGECLSISNNNLPLEVLSSCAADSVQVMTQFPCNSQTNKYDQELIIYLDRSPMTGDVIINGQSFPIIPDPDGMSPFAMPVTLTDLDSDGESVDLLVEFSEDETCFRLFPNVFQAPNNCCDILIELPDSIEVCAGTEVILDASAAQGEGFEWIIDGIKVPNYTETTIEAPNTGIYVVSVTNAFGCSKTDTSFVLQRNPPNLRFTNSNPNICDGQNLNLVLQNNARDSVFWYRDFDPTPIAEDVSSLLVGEAAIWDVWAINDIGCESRDTFETFVIPGVPEPFQDDFLQFCNGDIVPLIAGVDPTYVYDWVVNIGGVDNVIATGTSDNVLLAFLDGLYKVTVTAPNGCQYFDDINLNFNTVPVIGNLTAESLEFCDEDEITLDLDCDPCPIFFYWEKDGAPYATVSTTDIVITEGGTYSVYGENSFGCFTNDTLEITVESNPLPVLSGVDFYNPCDFDPINLSVNTDGNYQYNWTLDGDIIPGATNNTLDATPFGEGSYVLTATSDKGCISQFEIEVDVIENPENNFVNAPSKICLGEEITIVVNSNMPFMEWYHEGVLIQNPNANQSGSNFFLQVDYGGNFTALAVNNEGCELPVDIFVVEDASPIIDGGPDIVSCDATGLEIVLQTDESPGNPYTYTWFTSTEEGTSDDQLVFPPFPPTNPTTVSNLMTATYVVRALSQNGCITWDTINVSIDDAPVLNFDVERTEFCSGESVIINAQASTGTISWFKDDVLLMGENDYSLEVTETGVYRADLEIDQTCTATQSVTITVFDTPQIDLGEYDPLCAGLTTLIDAKPDQDGYTYEWSINGVVDPSLTTASFDLPTDLTPRNYTYEVTVTNGPCSVSASTEIFILDAPTLSLEATAEESCEDVVLTATTNLSGVEWFKDGELIVGATGTTYTVTETGTYLALASTGGQCDAQDELFIQIFNTPQIDGPLEISGCENIPINIDMELNGDFTYVWTINGEVDPTLTSEDITLDLMEGSYIVELTASEGICSDVHTIEVTIISSPTISLEASATEICVGDELIIEATTNLSVVTWLKDGIIINGETGTQLIVTESGVYTAMVSGGNNCDASDMITITVLDAPEINPLTDFSLCEGEDQVIDLMPNGTYSYTWTINGVLDGLQTSATFDLSTLVEGTYDIIAEATVGTCSTSASISVNVISSPTMTLDFLSSDICTGDILTITAISNLNDIIWTKDGDIIMGVNGNEIMVTEPGLYAASVEGGNNCNASDEVLVNVFDAPMLNGATNYSACEGQTITIDTEPEGNYLFTWSINGIPDPSLTGSSIELTEGIGSYTYVVTAMLGSCEVTESYTLDVISAPTVSLSAPDNFICNGSTMTLLATSNSSVIEWLLDGQVIMGETGVSLEINQGGTYTANVRLGNNCEASDVIIINGIDAPDISAPPTLGACEGEPLTIDVSAGGDYTYEWSVDGFIDMNLSGPSIDVDRPAGNYIYEVTAFDGECSTSQSIDINIIEAPTMSLSASELEACEGETITLSASSNLNTITWLKDGIVIPGETGLSLQVTESGNYTASVSAGIDCEASDDIQITISENPIIAGQDNYSACAGVIIPIEIDQMGDYSYTWVVNGIIDNDLIGNSISFDRPIGNYDIEVTAANGICTDVLNITVEVFDAASVAINQPIDAICEGDDLTVTATTNVSTLIWSFNGAQVAGVSGPSIQVNTGGLLAVFADAGNGCTAEDAVTIEAFPIPEISAVNTNISGCIGTPENLEVIPSGNYNYEWDLDGVILPGFNSSSITVDQEGTYTVTAFGDNNCSSQLQFNVSLQPAEIVSLQDDQELCEGDSFTINANTTSQNIVWYLNGNLIPGASGNQFVATETGIYVAETVSPNGCRASDNITLLFSSVPIVDLGPANTTLCEGTPFSLNVDASQGDVEWFQDGISIGSSASIDITETGNYSVVITNGVCTADDEMQVVFNNSVDVSLGPDQVVCEGSPFGLSFSAPPGSTFEWFLNGNPIGNNNTIQVTEAGIYSLEVTSGDGCNGSDDIMIDFAQNPVASVNDTEICPGESAVISTSGSFANYQWSNGSTEPTATYINQNAGNQDQVTQQSVIVTDNNGCQTTVFFEITMLAQLESSNQQLNYNACVGETVQFQINGGDTYEWFGQGLSDNSVSNPTTVATENTSYQVNISNANCPQNFTTVQITLEVYPEENTGIVTQDTCIIKGGELDLEAFGGVRYLWSPDELIIGSDRSKTPTVTVEETSIFNLIVTDVNGCTYEHMIEICAVEDPELVLKAVTIISPNNDGMNDALIIEGLEDFPDNQITIFNRWGNIIYEARAYQQGGEVWNGTRNGEVLPADTYYYVLKFGEFTIKKPITIVKE